VLKAPAHLAALRELAAVYPDVGVIMMHREPLEVLPSEASLHVVLRRTFSHAVDPAEVGRQVTTLMADELGDGLRARDGACLPADRFFDVRYRELVRDPSPSCGARMRTSTWPSRRAPRRACGSIWQKLPRTGTAPTYTRWESSG
jgi:hypothetical protein